LLFLWTKVGSGISSIRLGSLVNTRQFRVEAEKILFLSPGRGVLTNKEQSSAEKMNGALRKKPPKAKEFDSSTWPFFRFYYKN